MSEGFGMSGSITIEMSEVQSVQFTPGEDGATCPLASEGIWLSKLVGSAAGPESLASLEGQVGQASVEFKRLSEGVTRNITFSKWNLAWLWIP